MKKGWLLVWLFAGVLLLSGCMSRHVEEQLLVIILGVDEGENGDMTLIAKVPSNTSGEEGGAPGEEAAKGGNQLGYLTIFATGHQFADTLELLLATTPRSLNFSQVREIVISKKMAESPAFGPLLLQLYSLPRMHTQAVVVVCEGDTRAFIEEQKPYVGARLSRYIEVSIMNYAGKGFVPTTTLSEAVQEMGFGWQDPLLMLGALPGKAEGSTEEGNVLDVDAGELHSTSVNAVKLFGAAVTDGEKVSGTLTGYEMALLNLIRGHAQSLSLADEQGFSLPLYVRTPATLKVEEAGDKLRLCVDFLCEVHYTSGYPPGEEPIRRQLEEDITATIRKLQHMRCDALGFGGQWIRRFPTVKEWEVCNWRQKYEQAEVQVDVQLRLKKE